jgi:hypothetical protein
MAATSATGLCSLPQFGAGPTYGSSQQSLVEIGSVVSEKIFSYITGFYMNFDLLPILTDYAN